MLEHRRIAPGRTAIMLIKRLSGAALSAAVAIGLGLSVLPASAAYVVTLTQEGKDVVATGSGSIDLKDLGFDVTGDAGGGLEPASGTIVTGPETFPPTDFYKGFAGPTSFGSGGSTLASSGSGDVVGIAPSRSPVIIVPSGYVSRNPLSDTSTYDNTNFAKLGVTPGVYTWTWGSGTNADSFTPRRGSAGTVHLDHDARRVRGS
jgi:hypothetical protein